MQGRHMVLLDGKVLRTPARHVLAVPTEALALAIAAEWQWQVPMWCTVVWEPA